MRVALVRGLLLMAASCGLGGCGVPLGLGAMAKTPEGLAARAIVDKLAASDIDGVVALGNAAERLPNLRDAARQMSAFFPREAPTRVALVGFYVNKVTNTGSTTTTWQIQFESDFRDACVLSRVVFLEIDDGPRTLIGLQVDPLSQPLEVLNAFSFTGKGALHYLFLLLMPAVVGVHLAALLVWIRRRKSIRRRRWWWLVAVIVGVFKFSLNWTTGEISLQVLTMLLLGTGFERVGEVGPWILYVSIPAGAIGFLLRKPWKTEDNAPPAIAADPPAAPEPAPSPAPAGASDATTSQG